MLYGLKLDQEAGVQVVCASQGVAFEQLPDLVFQMDDLSEFEQHRAARMLKSVNRRPCTNVTNLTHLVKEPIMSFASQPEDAVQYKMEIYQCSDKGAEIVMEYPADNTQVPLMPLMGNRMGHSGRQVAECDRGSEPERRHSSGDLPAAERADVESGAQAVANQSKPTGPVVPYQDGHAQSPIQQTREDNYERLTFALSEKEMRSLLTLCRSVSGR